MGSLQLKLKPSAVGATKISQLLPVQWQCLPPEIAPYLLYRSDEALLGNALGAVLSPQTSECFLNFGEDPET